MMKFICPLIVVSDIQVSRRFYEDILSQKVLLDHGENVSFAGGFAIHLKSHFSELISLEETEIGQKPNNFELYFETSDFDSLLQRLEDAKVQYVHPLIEQPWGQRVIRFYDPDMHIVEVGEPMDIVAKRYLQTGLSVEETAKRISMPREFVAQFEGSE